MLTQKVEVCNLALSLLKSPAITNIDTPTNEVERQCALWYDVSRKEILRKHPWNFAKKRAVITRSADAPAFGFADKYELPNDFIRLRFIGEDNEGLVGISYDIEQDKYLLIDNDGGASLQIGYIFNEETVVRFDSLFLKALALQLAVNLSYGLAGKTTLRTDVRDMLMEALAEARSINGQDKPPIRITKSRVIGARRRYSTGIGYEGNPSRIPD